MKSIESFSYKYIVFSLLFGVLLYDIIGSLLHFTYIDELLLAVLLAVTCMYAKQNKEIKIAIFIYFFYLIYSLIFGVACKEAVATDAIIYLKPLVGFYGTYSLGLQLNKRHKKKIRHLVIIIAIMMIGMCLISYNYTMYSFMGHPSRFSTLFQILGMLYLLCSRRTKKDLVFTFVLWACALLSFRSKSYAFFVAAAFIFCILNAKRFQKINLSTLLIVGIGVCLMMIAAWEKFQFYFITGTSDDVSETFARPALYITATKIIQDYVPFGTGFGSYACHASGLYYSPLYAQYEMDNLYGLSKYYPAFINDTFFPQLAQFGIVGLILFFLFFRKRYKSTIQLYNLNKDTAILKMSILIMVFFMIESSTDTTFVHNRGMVMMILWAMLLKESEKNLLMTIYEKSSVSYKHRSAI